MQKSTKCAALRQGSLAALLTIGLGILLLSGFVSADEFAIPPAPSVGLEDVEQAGVETPEDGELSPTESVVLEIVEREADGTTVVEIESVTNDLETDVQTISRDGRSVTQVYVLVTPVTERIRVRVPPGEEVRSYLSQFSTSREDASRLEVVSEQRGQQSEELLFEIVDESADGTVVVELVLTVDDKVITTRERRNRHGELVEQICVVPVQEARAMTVSVPPGEKVFTYLDANPEIHDWLQRCMGKKEQVVTPTEVVYEIMDQQRDGRTFLQRERLKFNVEGGVREIVRDGKTVTQYYQRTTPEKECEMIKLRPGQSIIDYLCRVHGVDDDSVLIDFEVVTPEDEMDDVPLPPGC